MISDSRIDLSGIDLICFDFDGVFTDNSVYVDQNGSETVRCCRSDGIGLKRLAGIGVHAVVISTEPNPVVRVRCEKLRIPCYHGVEDKLKQLKQVMALFNTTPDRTAFVGNDINDREAMKHVGFPLAVADAYPEILDIACLCTEKPGGYGAVREICDLVCQSRANPLTVINRPGG